MCSALWEKYADRYAEMLLALAHVCDHVLSHPDDGVKRSREAGQEFSRVLVEAHNFGLLPEEELARMGMVQRSTANRWINGIARPSKLQQHVVMQKLAAQLRRVANEVKFVSSGKHEFL